MLADMIPAEQRINAYSLFRMGHHVGVSLSPAIGGLIATRSYTTAFAVVATGILFYAILMTFFAPETTPPQNFLVSESQYGPIPTTNAVLVVLFQGWSLR